MDPKVTVIVPTYNVEKYISKCLTSLINQTYNQIQIFVVSDGSKDNSIQIAQEFEKKDSRVKVLLKENGGYGSVLEFAINKLRTDYFLVCDPDDWLTPNAIKELIEFAEKENLDLVVGDKYKVFLEDNSQKYINSFNKKYNISPKKVYTSSTDIQRFAFGEGSPHAKLFRSEVAKNIAFPHKVSYTDTILYEVSLLNSKRVAYYNSALAYYLIDRPGNTMTDKSENSLRDHLVVMKSIFEQTLNHANKQPVILYYLYSLIIQFLNESSGHKNFFKKSNHKKVIFYLINSLQPYEATIYSFVNKEENGKRKFIFKGLMNKRFRSAFIKIYQVYLQKK